VRSFVKAAKYKAVEVVINSYEFVEASLILCSIQPVPTMYCLL